jgi:hypothetical protein
MKCNGKIGRLPANILEELHTRLRNGEHCFRLVVWLNSLPEVQAFLAEHFQGRPIKRQNLDEWKERNHSAWLVKKLREEIMAANENPDPALKELQDACQKYILDLQADNLAWYRRGYTDAIFGLPSLVPKLTDETKAEAN